MDPLQWHQQIESAVRNNAGNKSREVKEDLYQEALLAIIEAGEKVVSSGYAYGVAENRIRDVLRAERLAERPGKQRERGFYLEIHCPECGELKRDVPKKKLTACPDCGNVQAIILASTPQAYPEPQQETELSYDADLVVAALETLPAVEREIVQCLFGIRCEVETAVHLSERMGRSVDWVQRKKTIALRKLKALFVEIKKEL